MSRSYREAFHYECYGADPAAGKAETSRRLRRKIKERERAAEVFPDIEPDVDVTPELDDPRDRVRGRAGSRDPDYGWDYFGDGRIRHPSDDPKQKRK